MLQELLAKQLQNGLADFAGLQIEGSVPIKQELINAILADVLANGLPVSSKPASGTAAGATSAAGLSLDRETLQALVQQLVKRAEITAENGAITLHFEVRR